MRWTFRISFLILLAWAIFMVSPFVALLAAGRSSRPWAANARATMQALGLLVTLASLTVYTVAAMRWTRPTPAFLMVPLASWLLIAVGTTRAAWTARKG